MTRKRRFRGRIESQWLRQASGEHAAHAAAKDAWEEQQELQKHYAELKLDLIRSVRLTSSVERTTTRVAADATTLLAELAYGISRGATSAKEVAPSPPRVATLILSFVCTRDQLEAALGDMEELFASQVSRFGVQTARIWYWWEVLRSSLAFVARSIRSAIGLESLLKRL